MGVEFWVSLVFGVGLGVAHAALSLKIARAALARPQKQFAMVVLGGMVVRMFVLLILVALIVVLLPVHVGAFVGGLLTTFVLGLVGEAMLLVRQARVQRRRED